MTTVFNFKLLTVKNIQNNDNLRLKNHFEAIIILTRTNSVNEIRLHIGFFLVTSLKAIKIKVSVHF